MIVCFYLKWLDIEKGVVSNDREEREAPIQFRVSWKCFVNVVDSFEWIINGRNREQKIENHSTQHVKLVVYWLFVVIFVSHIQKSLFLMKEPANSHPKWQFLNRMWQILILGKNMFSNRSYGLHQ